MKLPRHDGNVKFLRGGVLMKRMPLTIHLLFHTQTGRIITDTSIPYFVILNGKEGDIASSISRAWQNACEFVSEKHLSRVDEEVVPTIIDEVKQLASKDEK